MGWSKSHTKSEITRPPKYIIPVMKVQGVSKMVLTSELEKEFRRLYPITPNLEMMQLFGIGLSTVQRFKRELGLSKDMKIIGHKHAMQIKEICKKNGYYETLKGRIPSNSCIEASKQFWKENGSPIALLKKKNRRKYNKYRKKRSEVWKEIWRKEVMRQEYGLTRRTKLQISSANYTTQQRSYRYGMKKLGYILGDTRERLGERYVIYYDSETQRNEVVEKNATEAGLNIMLLPDGE